MSNRYSHHLTRALEMGQKVAWPRLLHEQYDGLFKTIVSSEWGERSSGNVESPSGYFALVEIPSSEGERHEMVEALEVGEFILPDPGWYLTIENNGGLIWVHQYQSHYSAQREYNKLERLYVAWDTDEDEGR